MTSDSARKRRALYQRSLTVPAQNSDEEKNDDQLAELLGESSLKSNDEREKSGNNKVTGKNSDPTLTSTSSTRRRPPPLIRRNTVICGEPLIERTSAAEHSERAAISRSISTPSVILNKVREKIRRHAYQTSEWPPPSAVIRQHYHEKRRNSLPDKDFIPLGSRGESDTEWGSTSTTNSDRLRVQRSPRNQRYRRKSPPQERFGVETSKPGGGVICSKNDLKAIMYEFKDTTKAPKGNGKSKLEKSKTLSVSPRVQTRFQHSASVTTPSLRKQVSFEGSDDTSGHDALIPSSSVHEPDIPDVFMGEKSHKPKLIEIQNTDAYYDLKGSLCGDANPTVVKDVVYDEHGQTWDVYGAEFDPEIVGDAIQRHLNSIMKRNKKNTSASSLSEKQEPKRARTCEKTDNPETQNKAFMSWFCLFGRNN